MGNAASGEPGQEPAPSEGTDAGPQERPGCDVDCRSPSPPADASNRQPAALTAKEERVVLVLLQQGKSNLAVINHYTTQELELTLEQVQRVRELAGLDDAGKHRDQRSPPRKAGGLARGGARDAYAVYSDRVPASVHESAPKGAPASWLEQDERPHRPATPTSPNARRRPRLAPKGRIGADIDSSGPSDHPSNLVVAGSGVGPLLKKERSLLASTSARRSSGLIVMLSRHFGGLWGTLIGVGIYFVALYCAFMLVSHVLFILLAWIAAHKIVTLFLTLSATYLYLVLVLGEPWYLSLSTRETATAYSLHTALHVLQSMSLVITRLRCLIKGSEPDPPESEAG